MSGTSNKGAVLQVKVAPRSPADAGSQDPATRPLAVSNLPKRRSAGSPREGLRPKQGRRAPSPDAAIRSNENCRVQ